MPVLLSVSKRRTTWLYVHLCPKQQLCPRNGGVSWLCKKPSNSVPHKQGFIALGQVLLLVSWIPSHGQKTSSSKADVSKNVNMSFGSVRGCIPGPILWEYLAVGKLVLNIKQQSYLHRLNLVTVFPKLNKELPRASDNIAACKFINFRGILGCLTTVISNKTFIHWLESTSAAQIW